MASESVVKRPGLDVFVLPYGFVQSPILASLALDKSKLGAFLRKLNARSDLSVSVYVDDIIISSNDEISLEKVADQLHQTARASLFPISETKNEGPALGITAFNIQLSNKLLQITEARLAELHAVYQAASSANTQAGVFSYVHSVNTEQSNNLLLNKFSGIQSIP